MLGKFPKAKIREASLVHKMIPSISGLNVYPTYFTLYHVKDFEYHMKRSGGMSKTPPQN